jgi:hypothetical protein
VLRHLGRHIPVSPTSFLAERKILFTGDFRWTTAAWFGGWMALDAEFYSNNSNKFLFMHDSQISKAEKYSTLQCAISFL